MLEDLSDQMDRLVLLDQRRLLLVPKVLLVTPVLRDSKESLAHKESKDPRVIWVSLEQTPQCPDLRASRATDWRPDQLQVAGYRTTR